MNTLDQYMPAMREAPGRFYLPTRATVAAIVSAVLLVGGMTYAFRYPAMKAQEAIAHLSTYNGLISKANADTEAAIARLQGLLDGQPEWVQDAARKTIATVRTRLADAKPVDPDRILADAAKQQDAYDKAQAVIAASPFKGLKTEQIPLTAEGKAYLAALDVQPPARFEYQRLTDGVDTLLKVYRIALQVQGEAEKFAHSIDVRINGDKAGPAPEPVIDATPAMPSGLFGKSRADRSKADDESVLRQMIEEAAGGAAAKSDRPTAQPRGGLGLDLGAGPFGATVRKPTEQAPDPVAEAERQQQQEARRQQADADRAKAQAAREEAARQRAAQQQTLAAERAKAQAEADAARQRLQAERQAQQAERERQAAAEAKRRECTRSIISRAKCATEGYNPLTGEKR
ncbi:hypothetical protein GUF72_21485 [Xanthomonas citri pv. citri]|nr:hypothetical protein [Xanthomonas citri pv. citri]MBD1563955.1 hypothetical protein [Xanthomonas citri pv. citri]MBD4879863.1 hypothetical protein [Xanthomonas citri pv. citri]MBD4893881.1 hypothetical protein [Xanthomonas citri pv. citri]MBD4901961.1 hypothetical protein [Xanthomonas citri pv. citri]